MRKYIRRGSVTTRIEYERLRKEVWKDFYQYYTDGQVLHDNDIQFIAMVKAKEMGLHDFKVNYKSYKFKKSYSIKKKLFTF